jgi:hypothetical protein
MLRTEKLALTEKLEESARFVIQGIKSIPMMETHESVQKLDHLP